MSHDRVSLRTGGPIFFLTVDSIPTAVPTISAVMLLRPWIVILIPPANGYYSSCQWIINSCLGYYPYCRGSNSICSRLPPTGWYQWMLVLSNHVSITSDFISSRIRRRRALSSDKYFNVSISHTK